MGKKIVYSAVDNGIDGMSKDSILYSSFDEKELKSLLSKDPSRTFRTVKESIVEEESAIRKALSKLNGIDRLVLGLPNWVEERYPKK